MSVLTIAIRRGKSDLCGLSVWWSGRTGGLVRETALGLAEARGRQAAAASEHRLREYVIGIHAARSPRFLRRVHIGIEHGSPSLWLL